MQGIQTACNAHMQAACILGCSKLPCRGDSLLQEWNRLVAENVAACNSERHSKQEYRNDANGLTQRRRVFPFAVGSFLRLSCLS